MKPGIFSPRWIGTGKDRSTGVIIPPGSMFAPEWHEDGILYRYVGGKAMLEVEPPAWTKNDDCQEQARAALAAGGEQGGVALAEPFDDDGLMPIETERQA